MKKSKYFSWGEMGIQARLVCVTVVPIFILFVSLVTFNYFSRAAEAQVELSDMGKAFAKALAQSSEYGVVSENHDELQRSVTGILRANDNIAEIDIVTNNGVSLLHLVNHKVGNDDWRLFEVPIIRKKIPITAFSEYGIPHLADSSTADPGVSGSDVIGTVRIKLSSRDIFVRQRWHVIYTSIATALAMAITILCVFFLSKKVVAPLRDAIQAVSSIRSGAHLVNLPVTEAGEIGDLQLAINDMAVRLFESTQLLEATVAARTSDLKNERDKVLKTDADKRNLIKRQNSIAEEERRNIAIEIHDHLNASHIGIKLEAQRIVNLTKNHKSDETLERVQMHAQSILKESIELIDLSRKIVKRLRPEIIDILGLKDALDEMCNQYTEVMSSCRFILYTNGDLKPLDSELAICAYRLVQEALSNVIKHAQATRCTVNVALLEDFLKIGIQDDGIGFSTEQNRSGIGLVGMGERVHAFGGTIQIQSSSGEGTSIHIVFPLREVWQMF